MSRIEGVSPERPWGVFTEIVAKFKEPPSDDPTAFLCQIADAAFDLLQPWELEELKAEYERDTFAFFRRIGELCKNGRFNSAGN